MKYMLKAARRPLGKVAHLRALWLSITLAALLLTVGCGGGGGSSGGAPPPPTGSVALSVSDEYGAPITGARAEVSIGGTSLSGNTGADGTVTITSVPTGSASVAISLTDFDTATTSISVSANQTTDLAITLIRQTEPAAGVFAVDLVGDLASTDGQTLSFTVEVIVIDNDPAAPKAIETLTAADFSLLDCADTDTAVRECLRGPGGTPDIGYSLAGAAPAGFELMPGQVAGSYSATLLIDQSESIQQTDPTDARLVSVKAFIDNLGANDYLSLATFQLLPNSDFVTRISGFVQSSAGQGLFDAIDQLASSEGGDTPLFAALDQELEYVAANAPSNAGQRQAVVLFTDGVDGLCRPSDVPPCGVEESIARSQSLGVDIFTVGLGTDIDIDVMRRLADGGNGFFLFAENARQLLPIYRSMGELLSRTLATYRMTWTITADAASAYQAGRTVLGVLAINTGQNQIELPIRLFLTAP